MRPRVFPAEDSAHDAHHDGHAGASMRPRVFPAEDQAFLDDLAVASQLQ